MHTLRHCLKWSTSCVQLWTAHCSSWSIVGLNGWWIIWRREITSLVLLSVLITSSRQICVFILSGYTNRAGSAFHRDVIGKYAFSASSFVLDQFWNLMAFVIHQDHHCLHWNYDLPVRLCRCTCSTSAVFGIASSILVTLCLHCRLLQVHIRVHSVPETVSIII